jgi:ligand-binding SRPBCC domain-containing protein
MKIYNLTRTQFLPITLDEAWAFFSSPANLSKITPAQLGFKILYISGGPKAYAGQLIHYRIKVLPAIRVHWVTEITQVNEPFHFIDEQRFGPYSFWHHQHHFRKVNGGVEIMDEVNYALPFGPIGHFAHWLFVGRQVNAIFDFRFNVLQQFFPER